MKLTSTEEILVSELFKSSVKKNITIEEDITNIDKLVGDASTRRYFRVKTTTKSYIVCLSDPVLNREQNENFIRVQNCLHRNGITVPMVYDVVLDKGYFLEQDLGDNTLLKALGRVNNSEEEHQLLGEAIEEMIRIHSVDEDESHKASNNLSFDLEKLMYEVNLTTDNFLSGYLKAKLTDIERSTIESSFIKICTTLSSELMVLTHRDFHTRNVMINEGKQSIIDFQDARMGIPQYDLVSILEDNYYMFDPSAKEKIKQMYWENFVKPASLQDSYERYEELYKLMAIQRTYKALGTFGGIFVKRDDSRYLKYIGFAFERLRNHLQDFKEYTQLKNIISEHYYEQ